ncbi:cysteine--tRNA ligase, partial [Bacteroidota bacterium]
SKLHIYSSLSRKKELFEAINPPFVGLYVCGPTVYGEGHLGHARPSITFDLLLRYLKYLKYKVRYVRNITDVGHLENDADEGEDKIAKKAVLENLEPMEIVQKYTNSYHKNMSDLNVCNPSIEPRASGHIIDQILLIEKILKNGFAYEMNGSVYFDVEKYNTNHNYGKLSGRKIEDLISSSRELDKQQEKKNSFDFALWKKAEPSHIMRWPSAWGDGFPGWHLECSAMGSKYLGRKFDIHGGGMDLLFPHHECEIAQSVAANGEEPVKYWMHNNMITLNGQKMGKSLGNSITLNEFFSGEHKLLDQAYSPMTIRFFILQAHYRSTLDFSNEALIASEKGLQRLFKGMNTLNSLSISDKSSVNTTALKNKCFSAINDDLNTPVLISHLFDGVRMINSIKDGAETIDKDDLQTLKDLYKNFVNEILGLSEGEKSNEGDNLTSELINLLLNMRIDAKASKNYATSDKIRIELHKLGVIIKDTKDGFEWEIE